MVSIATLGSHCALQVLKGAKDEGLKTILLCEKKREHLYRRFKFIDEVFLMDSFLELVDGKISPEEYMKIAEVSSSQNNALLMELAYSDAPEEWQESYINRINSLKSFESYIIETMVMATLIEDDGEVEQKTGIMSNIEKLKEESIQYAQMADSAKP